MGKHVADLFYFYRSGACCGKCAGASGSSAAFPELELDVRHSLAGVRVGRDLNKCAWISLGIHPRAWQLPKCQQLNGGSVFRRGNAARPRLEIPRTPQL